MSHRHTDVEPFEIEIAEETLEDLRERLRRSRYPEQPRDLGWEYGFDFEYLRELCRHWADDYDWRTVERALNGLSNWRWRGTHFIWERTGAAPARGCRSA